MVVGSPNRGSHGRETRFEEAMEAEERSRAGEEEAIVEVEAVEESISRCRRQGRAQTET